MSSATATRCDRCGKEDLGFPKSWGQVQICRGEPFFNTGTIDLCDTCVSACYEFIRGKLSKQHDTSSATKVLKREDLVPVHADGGTCHGRALTGGVCLGCGIVPDMQSIELWPPEEARY